MNNLKFCSHCGSKIVSSSLFCVNCGTKIEDMPVVENIVSDNNLNNNINNDVANLNQSVIGNNNSVNTLNNKSNGDSYAIISLLLVYVTPFFLAFLGNLLPYEMQDFFSTFLTLGPLAGIVMMIMGRIKYPKNTFLKVVMWIYIINIVLAIVGLILLFIACYYMCSGC